MTDNGSRKFGVIGVLFLWAFEAVKEFIEIVNKKIEGKTISTSTALKFVLARKLDVPRAVALFEQHVLIRREEDLDNIEPMSDPLRTELETGKFTILPGRDATGAAIALFTANLHNPKDVTHRTTLQGVIFQLDAALQSVDTQKAGLVFIYDMSASKYSNFDYELSQRILNLLKGGYPARLKKVLIVTAPLWFKAPFKILRLFVREKLRERVFTVSIPQLSLHVPRDSLPVHLGGTHQINHSTWLLNCQKSMTNREDEHTASSIGEQLPSQASPIKEINCSVASSNSVNGNSNGSTDDVELVSVVDQQQQLNNQNNADNAAKVHAESNNDDTALVVSNGEPISEMWSENPPSSASSGFSDDDSLAYTEGDPKTGEQIVQMVRERGRDGLAKEYSEIRSRAPDGTFQQARVRANLAKNRYTDVLCYDHSRVILSKQNDETNSDYINANFVDGYKQKNAYISTQGPLPKTSSDFWRMVWEQHCLVIVMTTRVMERGRVKCGQYWETDVGSVAQYDNYCIKTTHVDSKEDYTVVSLELTNIKTEETRKISHWQFTSWPDYGVPTSAMAMLNFLQKVREQQAEMVRELGDTWAGHPKGPPIVVHCSAGIGRTGTFITLDICIARLEDVGTADIKGTVEKIRSQRAYSIQMPDQYIFCHLALIEYAVSRGMLKSADLSGFDDREEDSE
ncbi:tyrosine-protein phosphatase non-receptor type 9 isoform X2 [Sitodiplosis mosellana]|uniref:tyrosine-protein phosphatase non-receptor type 9 isoform X2 n=1 Tax=Sitodiplosis mosellana TaxID=263140 RepID=UPI002443B029|nr:tyrosine-protein phosphatase non-receptor type 9 isoform X2 [Sitodiplosis mosellana]